MFHAVGSTHESRIGHLSFEFLLWLVLSVDANSKDMSGHLFEIRVCNIDPSHTQRRKRYFQRNLTVALYCMMLILDLMFVADYM